jgi:hypothetical protein
MNLCHACGLDFARVESFDAHRVGKHAYTFAEGASRGRCDGRRCLLVSEIAERGWKLDSRGRWNHRPERTSPDAPGRGGIRPETPLDHGERVRGHVESDDPLAA